MILWGDPYGQSRATTILRGLQFFLLFGRRLPGPPLGNFGLMLAGSGGCTKIYSYTILLTFKYSPVLFMASKVFSEWFPYQSVIADCEGVHRKGIFHPWARWFGGLALAKNSSVAGAVAVVALPAGGRGNKGKCINIVIFYRNISKRIVLWVNSKTAGVHGSAWRYWTYKGKHLSQIIINVNLLIKSVHFGDWFWLNAHRIPYLSKHIKALFFFCY